MLSPVQIPGLYCLGVEQRMHASCGFPGRSPWRRQLPCVFLHPKKSSSNSRDWQDNCRERKKNKDEKEGGIREMDVWQELVG